MSSSTLPLLLAVLVCLTAALSYLNARVFRLPPTIGVLLGGLALAGVVGVSGTLGFPFALQVRAALQTLPFGEVVLSGLLSFLLFASAIQVNVRALFNERAVVLGLTVITTLVTMLVLGGSLYLVTPWLGLHLSFTEALLFGAIIAPTDPVAVLGLLSSAGVPERVRALIAGESLFNDGVGVAAFTVLVAAVGPHAQRVSTWALGGLLLQELLGGMALGAVLGVATAKLIRSAHDEVTAVLMSLALVTGGYVLGELLHVSAPVTVAAAGVMLVVHMRLSWRKRQQAQQAGLVVERAPEGGHRNIVSFWEITDQVLNAVLFVLLALEALVISFRPSLLLPGLAAALLSIAARGVGVWLPLTFYQKRAKHGAANLRPFPPHTRRLMTWAGLRGGVALALAFNLPGGELRDTLMFLTYVVVVFSLLVQGLTIPLVARQLPSSEALSARA